MTLATDKIGPRILDALHQRGHSTDDIARMSPSGAFCEFCIQHGFIGWAGAFWDAVENLRDASVFLPGYSVVVPIMA